MSNLTIAKTIMEQVGNKAFFMMGAKDFLGSENSLSFRIGRNAKGINRIEITLEPMDTYKVEFGTVRNLNYTLKASFNGIYVDQLHSLIEKETGLFLSL